MGLKDFENHLKTPGPGFRCEAAVDPFIVKLKHSLGPPATRTAITLLKKTLGPPSGRALLQFYSMHDGATLYKQSGAQSAGVRFFPIRQWATMTKRLHRRRKADEVDDWGNRIRQTYIGIVFGEIPRSGNYLIICTKGKQRGKIFYDNHDDASSRPLARDFESLLDMIWPDPARFLRRMGGYTRYDDGATDLQWIPERFLDNVRRSMR